MAKPLDGVALPAYFRRLGYEGTTQDLLIHIRNSPPSRTPGARRGNMPPTTPTEEVTADQKTHKPKRRIGEPSPRRDQVRTALPEEGAPYCSFSGPIKLEAARWLEATVQEVQCPTCGSVSKAKLKEQSVVISSYPPRKSRPVRNVTRWTEQGMEWVLVQKKE